MRSIEMSLSRQRKVLQSILFIFIIELKKNNKNNNNEWELVEKFFFFFLPTWRRPLPRKRSDPFPFMYLI